MNRVFKWMGAVWFVACVAAWAAKPSIDAIAADGMKFDRFYVHNRCSPNPRRVHDSERARELKQQMDAFMETFTQNIRPRKQVK